jgi:uncharacterized protein (TIGR00730 family)
MNAESLKKKILADSREELAARQRNTRYDGPESAYEFAFSDQSFLTRREMRGVRLQLEYTKPDLVQQEHGVDATMVVFGSARIKPKEQASTSHEQRMARYYEEARKLGELTATHGVSCVPDERLVVCTGGGPGIMEAANRGAFEAGGLSVGLNIALPHEQAPNPFLTPELCFQFHYFALRKMHFLMRAKVLVAFPGGFGTLDELFEVLTLIQTGKASPVPILLFDKAWWQKLINWDFLMSEGMISPQDLDLFRFVETADDAWAEICRFYAIGQARP